MAVELVSKGAQDVYLTGNPEVSFFRQTYKRYSNFAIREVQLTPLGSLSVNSEISLKIPNKGDLLGHIWIDLGLGTVASAGDTSNACGISADSDTGSAQFDLYIGGQLIDRQDASFAVQHWQKYLADSSAKNAAIIGTGGKGTDIGVQSWKYSNWLPLHFFFCDSVYLPLVALQYHEVEVRVKFSADDSSSLLSNLKFFANYIQLDTDERAAFVNTDHELLIEQVQRISFETNKFNLGLLNHPVKSLHWGIASADGLKTSNNQIYLNGTEIFNVPMPGRMFNQIAGYYYSEYAADALRNSNSSLHMHSFALKASKHQPCGTCNFSRIDTATFNMTVMGGTLNYLYAVNFNVLRIKKGLAGLAFSN
jgi:hypothetical protein